MSEVAITVVVSLLVFAGAMLGTTLNRVLPPHHVGEDTRRMVNAAVGLIVTLAALVLGLMVASTKASFDTRNDELKQSAARIVLLDRSLRQYGPEAVPARSLFLDLVRHRMTTKSIDSASAGEREASHRESLGIEKFQTLVRNLKPADDAQRWLQLRALNLSGEIELARWLLLDNDESSIQRPFLIVLVLWLVVIFASLGMFAPRHRTVQAVIVVCAFSVSTAVFLILEMDRPFGGLIQISDAPLQHALRQIER